ncbi:ABC transporter substrate-binding protein [Aliiruegeria lutimaris]|uniref:Peptide/nickel transport system substrate-binding protein n=1 Tax=Aliiruegeria lutimaris TaxID=571298 RepID=A0A1G9D7A2_9RHOB|nr:ABC transporter substrate-binding protein [Aliiruegeria lutimaris]SDK59816.1 peptide/nickel transport system substrate-binding protein [Aliiruegeria lutimaris]
MRIAFRKLAGLATASILAGTAVLAQDRATALIVAEDVAPQTFDPIQSSQIRTWYVWQLVYEGLVRAELDGSLTPLLASSWEIDETGTVYDFTLRGGTKFSDGSSVTPEDVVFSFERLKADGLPYAQDRFKSLTSVEKVDDTTVRFTLSGPDAGFMLNLGSPFVVGSAIMKADWVTSHDPKQEMLGTGPFALVSYAPNSELVLTRNENYWDSEEAAKVETLKIRYMPEQSAQIAAMLSGQIDLMFPSAESMLQLTRVPEVTTVAVASTNTVRLNINTNLEPFSNPDFRRAMSLSLNRDEIVAGAFLSEASPSAQIPPAYAWGPNLDELKYQKQDIEQAKELLAKAGYPDGIDITLNHLAGYATYLDRFAEILKGQMAEAGIRVTIEANQTAVWLDKQNSANYEIMTNEYAFQADPLFYLMPRPGRQGPTPQEMVDLIGAATSGPAAEYPAMLAKVAVMQDDLVFPDITVASRNAWVAYSDNVVSAEPDATISRTFLADVALK